MDIRVIPGCLNGAVSAIPSKSQAHRAMICAALADKPTRIECRGGSGDIDATVACLSAMGAEIIRENGVYIVYPFSPCGHRDGAPAILPCGESGATFRFLLPIAGALGRSVSFMPEGRLPKRPLSPLYEELMRHGCILSPQGAVPFYASGRLTRGSYTLDAGVSSQFVSGLLIALPLLCGDSELRLTGSVESLPYIEMTLAMLELFKIEIEYQNKVFSIKGGQTYRSPGAICVEGDWSNAAFWLCAGAIGVAGSAGFVDATGIGAGIDANGAVDYSKIGGGIDANGAVDASDIGSGINTNDAINATGIRSVTCAGLDLQSRQGDRAILDILARFGAGVVANRSSATVSGGKLKGIEIDVKDIPDLAPILAVTATAAEGTTIIRNAGRLRMKESDRLSAVTELLLGLGADAKIAGDSLIVRGGAALTGGQIFSRGDHRIAMAAAIAATTCAAPVIIRDAEAVDKSYPGFFEDLRSLGGHYLPLDADDTSSAVPTLHPP